MQGDLIMNMLITNEIKPTANQLGLTKKKAKKSHLVAQWQVRDGQLVCKWYNS